MTQAEAVSHPSFEPPGRRRFQRLTIALLGRYMLSNQREYPCQTTDVSPGDVHLVAPVRGDVGERIVLYLDHIGRLEGDVTRHSDDGFAIAISATTRKREKIAAQLFWLANRAPLELPEVRRHERVVPANPSIELTLPDGAHYTVQIIDISPSGAALLSTVAAAVGLPVIVGRTSARVVRHFSGGFAVEFGEILDQQDFTRLVEPMP